MKFLALDTATEACSAALYLDGVITERYEVAPREHARLILPMAGDLLAEAGLQPADMDAIAFGRGPGAFTGVRIAAGVVQGIAFAAEVPVLPVSDLAAVAIGAWRKHAANRILVCLDARMQEVYWGLYQTEYAPQSPEPTVTLLGAERLCPPEDVEIDGAAFAAGPGWSAYPVLGDRLATRLDGSDPTLLPRAADIARLAAPRIERGDAVPADQALPVYLRDEVAWKKA